MKRIFVISTILSCILSVKAQPSQWTDISNVDLGHGARDLYYSENLDMTVFCGVFLTAGGERYLGGFNGEEWIRLTDTLSSGIYTAVDYEDGLLIGGQPSYLNTQQMPHMAYFDGDEWSFPWEFNESVTKLKWVNDTLFALGFFTEVDGDLIYEVAKLVNGSWEGAFSKPDSLEWDVISDIAFYDGIYYISGKFVFENSITALLKIENETLIEATNQLVIGGWHGVGSLEVFQDELYIAGTIVAGPLGLGNPGNHIVRWDGEQLRDVGCNILEYPNNPAYGGIRGLEMIGDNIYAGGVFRACDDFPLFEIGRWDGSRWCSLFTSDFEQPELPFEQRLLEIGKCRDQRRFQ